MLAEVICSPRFVLHRLPTVSLSGYCPSLLIVLGQFQPGDDVHGLQLLEEQLAGIRDAEGGHVAGRLAEVAPARVSQESTLPTDINLKGIT